MKKHCNCHCFTLGDEYYIFDTYNYIILRVTKKFYEYVFSVCKGLKLHGEQYNHETEVFDEMVRNNYFFPIILLINLIYVQKMLPHYLLLQYMLVIFAVNIVLPIKEMILYIVR